MGETCRGRRRFEGFRTILHAVTCAVLAMPTAVVLGVLFFVYVGTENAVGGWLASYAKRVLEHRARSG